MKHFAKLATASVLALCTTATAWAQDTTLTIASWAPPTHPINASMWPEFTSMVEAASGGTVTAEVKYGLAPPPAMMDIVLDGAADVTWIFHGYTPGRFVATKLIELPGYEGNAEAASVASQRLHDNMLAALNEHKGVKVLAMMTHGPGQFHSNKPVNTLSDIDGMKVRIGGGVAGDVGAKLGMSGIRVPAPKVYETLDSGAADAVAMPAEGRMSFKLTEVAPHYYEMPGGFYRGSFAIIMNQETWDGLPADVQSALEAQVLGEPLARMAGKVWDMADKGGVDATNADDSNTTTVASADDQAAFKAIADEVIAAVKAEVAGMGIDADAAVQMIHDEMAK